MRVEGYNTNNRYNQSFGIMKTKNGLLFWPSIKKQHKQIAEAVRTLPGFKEFGETCDSVVKISKGPFDNYFMLTFKPYKPSKLRVFMEHICLKKENRVGVTLSSKAYLPVENLSEMSEITCNKIQRQVELSKCYDNAINASKK